MKALLYMSKRNFVNRCKKILKKPLTLLLTVLIVAYFVFILVMGGFALANADFKSPYGYLVVITLYTFYSFFGNFAGYAKRKGIIFKPSHAHFVFTAPIHPKIILLYGAVYNFTMTLIVSLLFVAAGVIGFHLAAWKVAAIFLVLFVFETLLEGSIIIFLYANEQLPEKIVTILARAIYILLIGITVFGVWYFRRNGMNLDSMKRFIDDSALQMLPIVGWNIAAFRLILLGSTKLNLICSGLYLLSVVIMTVIAVKMKCDGGYYEDAAKFADDYAEMKARSNRGEMVTTIGSKKKIQEGFCRLQDNRGKSNFLPTAFGI